MVWYAKWSDADWLCVLYRTPTGDGLVEYRWHYPRERETRWYATTPKEPGEVGLRDLLEATGKVYGDLKVGTASLPPALFTEEVEVIDGNLEIALGGKAWAQPPTSTRPRRRRG